MTRECVPLIVIQRQLGHSDLGITSVYPRHRQRRDHRKRPRPPRTDDPGQHVAPAQIGQQNRSAARRA
jgi:hypothetical protein